MALIGCVQCQTVPNSCLGLSILASHRPHHLLPPPTSPTLIRAIGDITVAVKKVAQNPAVLANRNS